MINASLLEKIDSIYYIVYIDFNDSVFYGVVSIIELIMKAQSTIARYCLWLLVTSSVVLLLSSCDDDDRYIHPDYPLTLSKTSDEFVVYVVGYEGDYYRTSGASYIGIDKIGLKGSDLYVTNGGSVYHIKLNEVTEDQWNWAEDENLSNWTRTAPEGVLLEDAAVFHAKLPQAH